jgi:hypothetical protein
VHNAWELGTDDPPGPRNFPSTRFLIFSKLNQEIWLSGKM